MQLRVTIPTAALTSAGPGVQIINANAPPSSIQVNQQFNFSVTGQVVNGNVVNPAVGLYFFDGPSNYINIVTPNGTTQLNKGTIEVAYITGTEPPGTTITLQAGVILPAPGTYTLQLVAGYLTDNGMVFTDYDTYTVNATAGASSPGSPGLPSAPSLPSWAPFAIVLAVVGGAAVAVAGLMYNQQQKLYQALAR